MARARGVYQADDPEWAMRAACRPGPGMPHRDDVFFPSKETRKLADAAWREFCVGCPVRLDCLQDALAAGDEGIRCGTTTEDRQKVDRKRSRVKCPLCLSRSVYHQDGRGQRPALEVCVACGQSWRADALPAPNATVLELPVPAAPLEQAEPAALTA